MPRPRLTLIDGHALAYRQYFAMQTGRFTTSKGEPTGAIYGFARTLIDLLSAESPTEYLAVVFDQGMSGREVELPAYKSTRARMDDSLVQQMERIRQLVNAFNIPILELANYEADDVIGSLITPALEAGVEVYIITGDRDLLQLVQEHVIVELPDRTGGGTVLFDNTESVVAKMGVRPDQVPDLKGLAGDSSDAIPGVKGVGDGTAVPLLNQYGSIESIYEHLGEIPNKTRPKLETGRESAFLSKKMATIMRDLPVKLDLAACAAHDFDPALVDTLFAELEFKSLRARLGKIKRFEPTSAETPTSVTSEPLTPAAAVIKTVIVDSPEKLEALVKALNAATIIAFDTETTGVDQSSADLVGISLSVDGETGYYLPVGHTPPDAGTLLEGEPPRQLPLGQVIEAIRPALTNPNIGKACHNAAFDVIMMRRAGIEITPISDDTMIGAWLTQVEGESKGLKVQARLRFRIEMTEIEELLGKGKKQITMNQVPVEQAAPYAAADAAITYRLVEEVHKELETAGLRRLYDELEMPLVPIIAQMNMTGALLDSAYLRSLSGEFAARLDQIKLKIYESVGREFNIGSPKQLNEIFFEQLKLPTGGLHKSSHGWSVDAEALEILSEHHTAPRLILDWRALEKLKNTYVDALPKQVDSVGRIHTSYNQTGTSTGRISSDSPNLQNIPIRTDEGRRVRRAFIAPPGYYLLSVDYSQVELRILAHYSKDTALIDAFLHDQDIHKATAALVYGVPLEQVTKEQRYFAKRVNFGLMYGMSAFRLARESEMSRTEAQAFVDRYFERLPGVDAYLKRSKELARTQGYLETLFGRRRDFKALQNKTLSSTDRGRIEREAINMPIQGTAADIIKVAMIRLSKRLPVDLPGTRMILQVHDELVFEVPEDQVKPAAALVREVMEGAYQLDAPLRADANWGQNWAEMQPV
ncbi:MAG: DNA polymerase I [Anaerolinea sp.]|nr:DNA polymerase I [Anaerolinea sp.]